MTPLMVLALVLVPVSRIVVSSALPVMPPPRIKVPAPAPAPLALLLAKMPSVPPVPSMTSGALMVSMALVAVSVSRIWILPPLLKKSGLPTVVPMK